MTLTKRITELMNSLVTGIPEREFYIQLGFLATLMGEPFYLYGRSGAGKSLIIQRLISAFKNSKVLKLGARNEEIPSNISEYNFIVFLSYNPAVESSKDNVNIAIQDRDKVSSFIISGDLRPEEALSRGEIIDKIPLTIMLPESISAKALCTILQNNGESQLHISPGLMISNEERTQWVESIKKISLSEDVLFVIAELVYVCEKNNIYVPIRKWMALTNIMRAVAFFNDRAETKITDTFFLGLPIWSRATYNTTIMECYRKIILNRLLKETPNILNRSYNADDLLFRVKKLIQSSNNLYETKIFNNEPCLFYRITIAGESVPLYAPFRYIETEGDFFPYNELRQEEKRVRCNYHGTSSCTISVASSVKSAGIRNSASRNLQPSPKEKYEDYGVLPTHILKENDSEIIEKKKIEIGEIRQEIQMMAEQETKTMQSLKSVFATIKSSKEDLFCNKEFITELQEQVSALFDSTKVILSKVKEAHDFLAEHGY